MVSLADLPEDAVAVVLSFLEKTDTGCVSKSGCILQHWANIQHVWSLYIVRDFGISALPTVGGGEGGPQQPLPPRWTVTVLSPPSGLLRGDGEAAASGPDALSGLFTYPWGMQAVGHALGPQPALLTAPKARYRQLALLQKQVLQARTQMIESFYRARFPVLPWIFPATWMGRSRDRGRGSFLVVPLPCPQPGAWLCWKPSH